MNHPLRRSLLAALLTGLVFTTPLAAAKTILKLNSQWPATAAGSKIDQWYADEVKKRTEGEVEIKIFWSEALGKAGENLSLIQKGAVEMGAMSPAYFPTQLPFHTAPNSIPMAMDSVKQANVLMNRLLAEVPALAAEAKANGVRTLFFHHLNPYLLVSKEPLTDLEVLKGKKIRTWGSDMPRMAQAAGMTPVTLSLPEIYEGLGRGVIDAAPFSVDLVMTYKIFEVAKNISEATLWLGPSWGVWIGEAAWQKLTPKQQKVMLEVASEANHRDMEATIAAEKAAREELLKRGVKFHAFPEADRQKWKAALPDFFAEFIATQEKLGKGTDAAHMVKVWKEVVETVK
ncbi:MAG: C4-dicarboxylate TRAP transporter substrate-binding protein [Burkholderiaceae bacterium]|jgi:TRAP-type C4-dicarboxylate transport system substrate-binding protein|nr:C4-dicarboxylate TRAP transporter substrate-binding protein [Burkholderiaceae bacterium]